MPAAHPPHLEGRVKVENQPWLATAIGIEGGRYEGKKALENLNAC